MAEKTHCTDWIINGKERKNILGAGKEKEEKFNWKRKCNHSLFDFFSKKKYKKEFFLFFF